MTEPEKIDQLRDLLEVHDRKVVSLVQLEGIRNVPDDEAPYLGYERTGDIAVVLVGPEDQLQGIFRENKEDGSVTLEFTFPGAARGV